MVFYAYAEQSNNYWSARYLITFASRGVADEWWRAVSTTTVVKFSESIQRVNAQFYTYNMARARISDSLATNGVATQFSNKMFFTLLDDESGRHLSVIPSPDFADHISGNSFFSFAQKSHLTTTGTVPYRLTAMRQTRSMFRVPNALVSVLVSAAGALQGPL
jgi:hypothetical protein